MRVRRRSFAGRTLIISDTPRHDDAAPYVSESVIVLMFEDCMGCGACFFNARCPVALYDRRLSHRSARRKGARSPPRPER